MDVPVTGAPPEAAALAAIPRRAYAESLRLVDEVVVGRQRWLVTVDGRSGAGKTHLGASLAARHPQAQVLHLDDLYRDWDDLAAGLLRARHIAEQWHRGNSSSYLPTQWPGTEARRHVTVDPGRPLLVEGVGSTWVGRDYARLALWLEADRTLRCKRALERDGDVFAPHWSAWADQEDAWFAVHPPRADVVVPCPGANAPPTMQR